MAGLAVSKNQESLRSVLVGLACFSLLALPLFLIFSWHRLNQYLPRADASDYFQITQKIYLAFQEGGVWEAIKASYILRGWRPIFTPVVGAPFAIWNDGEILSTVMMTNLFLYGLLLLYAFLNARVYLDPFRAAVCAAFMGLLPWLLNHANLYMSEIAWVAFSLATFFHLQRSDYFRRKVQTLAFAVFMALTLWVRPVEGVFSFVLVLGLVISGALRRGSLNRSDLVFSVLAFVPPVILMLARIKSIYLMSAAFFLGLVWIGVGLFGRRYRVNRVYLSSFLIFFGMVAFWWAPFVKRLLSWVNTATGAMAMDVYNEGQMGFFEAMAAFAHELGRWHLYIPVLLFLGIALLDRRRLQVLRNGLRTHGLALLVLVGPVFLISLTPDIDLRRGYLGISVWVLAAMIVAISPRYRFARTRVLFLTSFTLLQALFLHGRIHKEYSPVFGKIPWQWDQAYSIPYLDPDPSLQVFEWLQEEGLEGARVAVLSVLGMDNSTLSLLAQREGSALSYNYPQLFGEIEEGLEGLQGYDYVVLDAGSKIVDPPEKRAGYLRLTAALREMIEKSGLGEWGLFQMAERLVNGKPIILLETARGRQRRLRVSAS